ncbi:MAG: ATP-dependent helicase [Actinobacteria bacterium]|nr:ATP-dependent helicase [Actinomycetota bacterium]
MQKLSHLKLADLGGLASSGAYCVVGAPGTGKTAELISLAIEAEQLYLPEEILVLTASRSQASLLRDQISARSKRASSVPRAVSITALAYRMLTQSGQQVRLLTGPSQEQILRKLITEAEPSLRSAGFNPCSVQLSAFLQEMRDLLQVVMDFGLKLEDLVSLKRQFPALKLEILIVIFERYLSELENGGWVDASSLLTRALDLNVDVKLVLVDDAQEFSTAGLKLLAKLLEKSPGVIFGDPDSATQGFRAAEPGAFLALGERIYLAKESVISPVNQSVLAKLAQRIPPAGAGVQRSTLKSEFQLESLLFETTSAEADYLATKLRRARLEEAIDFSQMAVVLRTRSQLEQLAKDLALREVPVRVVGPDQPLSRNQLTRAILDVASTMFQAPDRALLVEVLQSSLFGLTQIQIRRLDRVLVHHFGERVEQAWLSAIELGIELETAETRVFTRLVQVIRSLRSAEPKKAHELVSRVFEEAPKNLRELAKSKAAVATAVNRDIDAVLRLFAAAIRFDDQGSGTIQDFVEQQLDQRIAEDALFASADLDAVTLLTPSALAGRRFELIAIPRLQDGIWPNLKLRNSLLGAGSLRSYLAGRSPNPTDSIRGELGDELRLFYKAVGAANFRLLLSAMQSEDEQPSQIFTVIGSEPKLFSERIDFDLRRFVGTLRRDFASGDQSAAGLLALLALADVPGANPETWHGALDPSSRESLFGSEEPVLLNASSLQAFETCPLHWFIETFAVGRQSFQASIGTLLHKALELAKQPSDIPQFVESNWHELEFEHSWQERTQRQRAMEMAALLASYLAESEAPIAVEQGFELTLGRLSIRGKIDRIEQTSEGLVVADLKTGKSVSDAEGNRQLALYQLAISRSNPDSKVAGGKLISVGTGKLKVLNQPALDEEASSELIQALTNFENSVTEAVLSANTKAHCSSDSECRILISQVVKLG